MVSEHISIHEIGTSKNVFLGYVLLVVSSCVPGIPPLQSLIRGNACAVDFYVCISVGKCFRFFGFTAAAVANTPGASDNSTAVVQLSSRTLQLFLRFC